MRKYLCILLAAMLLLLVEAQQSNACPQESAEVSVSGKDHGCLSARELEKQKIREQKKQEKERKRLARQTEKARKAALRCGWVDLGLPSGTLWKAENEEGFYTYEQAGEKFGSDLPTKEQWEELKDSCRWVCTREGYEVTGPNGNSILLPAAGDPGRNGGVEHLGIYGSYWSSALYDEKEAWYLYFRPCEVYIYYRSLSIGRSVRCAR